ncbi:MAG: hypothetical protein ACJAVK_003489 [Akkermansiaceae bacterium]|jgi:hypothetical protein
MSLSKSQTVELLTLKTSPTPDAVDLEWVGESGKFYYLQCSADLEDWNFMGRVDAGDGSVISYGFPTNFTSLNYRVVIRLTPPTGDADGDGLTDEEEHFGDMTPMMQIRMTMVSMIVRKWLRGPILDLQLKSFEPVDGDTTLNLLNVRDGEITGTNQYRIDDIAITSPSSG